MTDEQFQALSRSFGNLAAAVAKMHTDLTAVKEDLTAVKEDLTDLKETVHGQVVPFLRRIDGRLAVVESRWSNIEGRLATSEMRQAAIEQIVNKRDDPRP